MEKDKSGYTVNNKFYGLMLLSALVIAFSLFIALLCNIGNSAVVAALSALISIFGGGIISVVTAWLIERYNCKVLNKNLGELKTISLNALQYCFFSLFISFVVLNKNGNTKKIWTEWAKSITEISDDKDFCERKSFIMEFVKAIEKEIEQIESRKEIIAYQHILLPSDIIALQNIKSNLKIWISVMEQPTLNKDLYLSVIDDLNLQLAKCEPLKFLCTVEFNDYEDLFNAAAE